MSNCIKDISRLCLIIGDVFNSVERYFLKVMNNVLKIFLFKHTIFGNKDIFDWITLMISLIELEISNSIKDIYFNTYIFN